jgi:hypothetical protein
MRYEIFSRRFWFWILTVVVASSVGAQATVPTSCQEAAVRIGYRDGENAVYAKSALNSTELKCTKTFQSDQSLEKTFRKCSAHYPQKRLGKNSDDTIRFWDLFMSGLRQGRGAARWLVSEEASSSVCQFRSLPSWLYTEDEMVQRLVR